MIFLLHWTKRSIPCIRLLLRPQFWSFDLIAVVEDIVPGKKKFHTIFFTHQDNFSALLRKNLRKKFKIGTPYYTHLHLQN